MSEVDDHFGIGSGQRTELVTGIDTDGEGQIVRRFNRLDHGRADLAPCTKNTNSHGWQPTARDFRPRPMALQKLWPLWPHAPHIDEKCQMFELMFEA
ncbi:hypothetical protein MMAGJ_56640 [Mycolicibacterium mageritense]|uniref:Uncharacterized protein n=1 Tax=Mycolicibacterium mageritense TaxID=53462 RepID=A0ABM7I0H1_MYCME|nr:hypothetical protein MMAGJ_56640 [Mycolicibacterium mageritense]